MPSFLPPRSEPSFAVLVPGIKAGGALKTPSCSRLSSPANLQILHVLFFFTETSWILCFVFTEVAFPIQVDYVFSEVKTGAQRHLITSSVIQLECGRATLKPMFPSLLFLPLQYSLEYLSAQ